MEVKLGQRLVFLLCASDLLFERLSEWLKNCTYGFIEYCLINIGLIYIYSDLSCKASFSSILEQRRLLPR